MFLTGMIYPYANQQVYFVYILLCSDQSLYVGLTNDIIRRIEEHQQGVYPSCYTCRRRPVELKYFETIPFLEEAVQREKQLKGWSRAKKQALIDQNLHKLHLLAQCQNFTHTDFKDVRNEKGR